MKPRLKLALRSLIFSSLSLLFLSTSAFSQTLYGAATDSSSGGQPKPSNLYTIDPTTGNATVIGPIGFNNVTGLAFLPDGRLVGTANGDQEFGPNTAILIEIDPQTGQGSLIGVIDDNINGDCGRMPDITYDLTSDTLFAYGHNCNSSPHLYKVDPQTGAGTPLLNPSGFSGGGNGLAAQPETGEIFHAPSDNYSLIILDPITGIGNEIPASINQLYWTSAMDFHPVSLELYGAVWPPDVGSYLVKIDTQDGTTTVIGQTVLGLDAIAFSRFCGDAQTTSHEECDDGNDDNTDACLNNCKLATCGDGFVQAGVEECDDGNDIDGDGCTACANDPEATPECDPSTQNCGGSNSNTAGSVDLQGGSCALSTGKTSGHLALILLPLLSAGFALSLRKRA